MYSMYKMDKWIKIKQALSAHSITTTHTSQFSTRQYQYLHKHIFSIHTFAPFCGSLYTCTPYVLRDHSCNHIHLFLYFFVSHIVHILQYLGSNSTTDQNGAVKNITCLKQLSNFQHFKYLCTYRIPWKYHSHFKLGSSKFGC